MPRTPTVHANPAVLKWARELAGWTIEDLAKRLQTKPERVHDWETSVRAPTLGQLRRLADLYRRPVAVFLLAETPGDDLPQVPDFRGTEASSTLSRTMRQELRRADQRRQVLIQLGPRHQFTLGQLPTDFQDLAAATAAVRMALGITVSDQLTTANAYDALRFWTDQLTDAGVLIFTMSRVGTDECRGFSVHHELLPVIVTNGADPPQARAFTLLHEVGHLLQRSSGLCTLFADIAVERDCNAFAAEMLMPEREFLDRLGQAPPLEVLPELARTFRVSREAAAVRLRVLGRITQADLDNVRRETAARLAEAKEQQREQDGGPPHHRTKLRNLGDDYVSAVLDARDDQRITEAQAAHFLESKLTTMDRMQEELARRGAAT